MSQGVIIFDPLSPGKYEARAYYNYNRNGYVVSGRYAFSVASTPAGEAATDQRAEAPASRPVDAVASAISGLPPAKLTEGNYARAGGYIEALSLVQKQRAEQESQRMEFILTKEKQEAERKRIEAQGIADFQTIVAKGISDPLLRWKGIEATEKLAASSNTKVIIVGSGKDGLPVILDTK